MIPLWAATALAAPHCGTEVDLDALGPICPTHALHIARAQADARGTGLCLDAALAERGLAPGPSSQPIPPPGDKGSRDVYGLPGLYETENFAIRWGNTVGFSEDDIARLALGLEEAWQGLFVDRGWPGPEYSEDWRINIYIGDSGAGAPESLGYGGYFWYDDDGYPMVVLDKDKLVEDHAATLTATHELFHGVQYAIDTYAYSGPGAWLFEASAMWVEGEVFPSDPDYTKFLWAFAFRPELPVHFFQYPQAPYEPEELHQYGAMIFVRHLTENVADPSLVERLWLEGSPELQPMAVLEGLLAEDGVELDDVFFEMAARNATWDYADSELYAWRIDDKGGWTHPDSDRPAGVFIGAKSEWASPEAPGPASYGASYWSLQLPPDHFEVELEADPAARWSLAVAARNDDRHWRWHTEGATSSLIVELPERPDEAWIVVAATDDLATDGPRFDYRLRVVDLSPVDDDEVPESPRACGCTSPDARPDWLGWARWLARRRL